MDDALFSTDIYNKCGILIWMNWATSANVICLSSKIILLLNKTSSIPSLLMTHHELFVCKSSVLNPISIAKRVAKKIIALHHWVNEKNKSVNMMSKTIKFLFRN